MSTSLHLPLALLAVGLLLGGCTHEATRSNSATATTPRSSSATPAPTHTRTHTSATDTTAPAPDTSAIGDGNERTGIAACDDYLSSYLACHRAAKIYAPGQLLPRYEAMRTSLLRDARNPDIRPQLGARCNALSTQLRQALHGKSCTPEPASP